MNASRLLCPFAVIRKTITGLLLAVLLAAAGWAEGPANAPDSSVPLQQLSLEQLGNVEVTEGTGVGLSTVRRIIKKAWRGDLGKEQSRRGCNVLFYTCG